MESSERKRIEREAVLGALTALVGPLNQTLADPSEVVLHDLSKLPDSIIAIDGHVTGRSVGGPATDRLLAAASQGRLKTRIGYRTGNMDGDLRSTTIVVRDSDGEPFAALCINHDVALWRSVGAIADAMVKGRWGKVDDDGAVEEEAFVRDVEDLGKHLLESSIAKIGVPVEQMQKRHKLAVVQELRKRGFFTIRESTETAAKALGVTRFTVYNYLNELDAQADSGIPGDVREVDAEA